MLTPFYRAIRPEGWLRRQLEIQARGLSGHLHEVWPDVRESAWIGGVERKFPYCDYDLIPQSPWNFDFAGKELSVREREISDIPFSSKEPTLEIVCAMAQVKWDWADSYDSVPAALPASRKAISPV